MRQAFDVQRTELHTILCHAKVKVGGSIFLYVASVIDQMMEIASLPFVGATRCLRTADVEHILSISCIQMWKSVENSFSIHALICQMWLVSVIHIFAWYGPEVPRCYRNTSITKHWILVPNFRRKISNFCLAQMLYPKLCNKLNVPKAQYVCECVFHDICVSEGLNHRTSLRIAMIREKVEQGKTV